MRAIQRGFTLIEIMVVVVIIGILAAIIVPNIMSRPEQARLVKAQEDITSTGNALDLYKLDNGSYPTTDQGLSALVTKPSSDPAPMNWKDGGYLKQLPVDPWNNPYQYLNPGTHGANQYDLWSFGPNGKTASSKDYIGNWTVNNKGN